MVSGVEDRGVLPGREPVKRTEGTRLRDAKVFGLIKKSVKKGGRWV